MERLPPRRFSGTTNSNSPLISPDGHVGTERELENLPARLRDAQSLDSPRYDVYTQTSRSGASSRSTNTRANPSGSSSPSRYMAHGKGKAKTWSPPPPISASIYGSMNPLASFLRPSRPPSAHSQPEALAQSTYRRVSFGITNPTVVDDLFLVLSQREQQLQTELQELLDAQSDGLQAGLTGDQTGTASVISDGSNTPTGSKSPKMPSQFRDDKYSSMIVRPVRQPIKKMPSLRAARRGILRTINELANIKEEEDALVSEQLASKQSILRTIDGWEQKMADFRKAIEGTTRSEEAKELQNLHLEKRAAEDEIHELESRLLEMHGKKRTLASRISELQNRSEAGVSSYKEGLRLVEKNVEKFLNDSGHGGEGRDASVWALPPNRRTLGLARDYFAEELDSYKSRKQQIDAEGLALIEGAEVWTGAMNGVMSWEANLRKALTTLQDEQGAAVKQVANEVDILINELETKEATAEERGWKLLIVAIGAEIAYLKEGREVLRNILHVVDKTGPNSGSLSGPIRRENTEGVTDSFCTAEGGSSSVIRLRSQSHELSEFDSENHATSKSQSQTYLGDSGSPTPSALANSQVSGLRNSISRKSSGNERMTGSGSGHFKNGSISVPRNSETPELLESTPFGERAAKLSGLSPHFDGTRSPGMTGSGRLGRSWRDAGKGRLSREQESSTESDDEGPDPDLLVDHVAG